MTPALKEASPTTAVSVHDVVAYILSKTGKISVWKLQKLVYYAQVWSLVWDDAPLFPEKIYAWGNGPCVEALYEFHKGQFSISTWRRGKRSHLTSEQKETLDEIIASYGPLDGWHLSRLVQCELPWKEARGDLPISIRGHQEIKPVTLQEYYTALSADDSLPSIGEIVWE